MVNIEAMENYRKEYGYVEISETNKNSLKEILKDCSSVLDNGCGTGAWGEVITNEFRKEYLGYRLKDFYSCDSQKPAAAVIDFTHESDYKILLNHIKGFDAWLLFWPPYNTDFAFEVLKSFIQNPDAKKLVYIGESEDGCTGNYDFFELLDELEIDNKVKVDYNHEYESLVSGFLHDRLWVIEKIQK